MIPSEFPLRGTQEAQGQNQELLARCCQGKPAWGWSPLHGICHHSSDGNEVDGGDLKCFKTARKYNYELEALGLGVPGPGEGFSKGEENKSFH